MGVLLVVGRLLVHGGCYALVFGVDERADPTFAVVTRGDNSDVSTLIADLSSKNCVSGAWVRKLLFEMFVSLVISRRASWGSIFWLLY